MNTTMEELAVRVATPSDHDAVIEALTMAFSSDPAARWAFPDPQDYLAGETPQPNLRKAWTKFWARRFLAFGRRVADRFRPVKTVTQR